MRNDLLMQLYGWEMMDENEIISESNTPEKSTISQIAYKNVLMNDL